MPVNPIHTITMDGTGAFKLQKKMQKHNKSTIKVIHMTRALYSNLSVAIFLKYSFLNILKKNLLFVLQTQNKTKQVYNDMRASR